MPEFQIYVITFVVYKITKNQMLEV